MDNLNQKQERFGIRLAECRRNKNFTQEEMANRLGVTPQALSKWEKGLSSPDITMVCAICEVLGVSADYMLEVGKEKITEDSNSIIQDEIWNSLRRGLEPLKLVIGTEVVQAFANDEEGNWYGAEASNIRQLLSQEGILLPTIRIMDQQCIKAKEFYILAYDNVLYREELTEIKEDTCWYVFEKLRQTVREKYAEILNVDILKSLTDNLRIQYPALIDGVVPEKISYGLLLDVCKEFLNRGNSLIYLPKIIEVMERGIRECPEITVSGLTEQVCMQIERKDNFWVMIKSS